MTSTGIAEPPETQRSTVETSNSSRFGWWSRAEYMVGTPANDVTLSRAMSSSALPGSKRGRSVSRPRARMATFMTEFMPKTWNSGRVARATKSGPASARSRATAAPPGGLLCVEGGAREGRPGIDEVAGDVGAARDVAVREGGALRRPGRAGGVDDHRRVVFC